MKNILLTGASKGLGLVITEILAKKNYKVYTISRSQSKGLASLIEQYPNNIFYKAFDLEDTDNIKEEIFRNFIPLNTPLHGFVNNAAWAYDDIITNLKTDSLNKMFSINVFSPFMIVKYAIRNMLYNKTNGSIVHISSISVHTGYKGLSMYAASKGALEAFSKNTAREWGSKKIRSNSVVAGFMETAMSSTLTADQKNRIYKRTSLKLPTALQSVAATVSFLLSEEAFSITGQNIFVDSGTI